MERLSATGGSLPLAFQVGDHLEGRLDPFHLHADDWWANELATQDVFAGETKDLDNGTPIYGDALNAKLAEEGYGAHDTRIAGLAALAGGDELIPWSKLITLMGSIDWRELARACYQMARDFIKGYSPGDTPPEIYITDIQVGELPTPQLRLPIDEIPERQLPPRPSRIRKGQTAYVGYVDSKTGEFISREKYLHSRRALKGVAKRKGLTRPRKGRYVRTLLPL